MAEIKIDEGFIRDVQEKLTRTRNEVVQVRYGVNPGDAGHTHGVKFNGLQVQAGASSFAAGANLTARLSGLASQTDSKLVSFDTKLSGHEQGLEHILASSDSIEEANKSYASFSSYLPNSGSGSSAGPNPPAKTP
jgi:hypothetical protein